MRLLLDTHALLWWWDDDTRISTSIAQKLSDSDNVLLVSAVTAWEIATKVRIGKLTLQKDIAHFTAMLHRDSFTDLPVSREHGLLAGTLPGNHRDPFDRMLAAQAIVEQIPILSRDGALDAFGCERIWE